MATTRQTEAIVRSAGRQGAGASDRLVIAVLLSAAVHAALVVAVRVPAAPTDPLDATLQPVTIIDALPSTVEQEAAGDPTGDALAALTAFDAAADARVSALESQLATEVARRSEEARTKAAALAAELERGTAEQTRLAAEAAALHTELANRDAALAAAAARAAEAEQAAAEARRQAVEAAAWKTAYDDLARAFQREIAAKEVSLQRLAQGVALSISDRILFASGTATVGPEGAGMLDRMTEVLKRLPTRRARIEGHTDNVPIGPGLVSQFPTNWELSTARATAVVKYLVAHGVTSGRLAAAGYAETRPVAPNDKEAGRAQNRRIEIVVIPDSQPTQVPADRGT